MFFFFNLAIFSSQFKIMDHSKQWDFRIQPLHQWFSTLSVFQSHLWSMLSHRFMGSNSRAFDSESLEWSPRFCIFYKFPGDADATFPHTIISCLTPGNYYKFIKKRIFYKWEKKARTLITQKKKKRVPRKMRSQWNSIIA